MSAPFARKTFAVMRLSDSRRRRNWSSRSATPSSNSPRSWSRRRSTTPPSTRPRRAGIAPKVEIAVDSANRTITVADHGRGAAPGTVEALVDLTQKESSRASYVSPTRRQQGNARGRQFSPCRAPRARRLIKAKPRLVVSVRHLDRDQHTVIAIEPAVQGRAKR
jgi:hypothetical protein